MHRGPEAVATLVEAAKRAERDGALDEALERYEQAFAALDRGCLPGTAADLFRWIGTVHELRESLELATEAYWASAAIAEAAEDPGRVGAALNCLGIVAQFGGDLTGAEWYYRRARMLAEESGDDSLQAMTDQNLATVANIRGDVADALRSYQSALDRLLRFGRDEAAARVLNNMGMANVDLEAWEDAARCLDRAYDIADRLRDSALIAVVDLNRAELHLRKKELGQARDACDRAFETYGRIGSDVGAAECLKLYGAIARHGGKHYLAGNHFDAALDLARRSGDPLLEAEVEAERSILFLDREQNQEALRSLNRAHRLFSELQARRELFDLDRRLDDLEHTYLEVVERWGASIEAKDEYTAGHCERVADYACLLAAALGYEGRDLTWFRMGGFLHDVGKTAVPAEVLNKPGKLTAEEWELMKAHTTVGYDIVAELNFPWDIAPLVRSHHEKWDGSGYPDGLAGEEIPLTARILCVADVYDALTTARSYRGALSHDEAIGIMDRDADTAFDPELYRLFRSLIASRRETTRPSPRSRRPPERPATTAAG